MERTITVVATQNSWDAPFAQWEHITDGHVLFRRDDQTPLGPFRVKFHVYHANVFINGELCEFDEKRQPKGEPYKYFHEAGALTPKEFNAWEKALRVSNHENNRFKIVTDNGFGMSYILEDVNGVWLMRAQFET